MHSVQNHVVLHHGVHYVAVAETAVPFEDDEVHGFAV